MNWLNISSESYFLSGLLEIKNDFKPWIDKFWINVPKLCYPLVPPVWTPAKCDFNWMSIKFCKNMGDPLWPPDV